MWLDQNTFRILLYYRSLNNSMHDLSTFYNKLSIFEAVFNINTRIILLGNSNIDHNQFYILNNILVTTL